MIVPRWIPLSKHEMFEGLQPYLDSDDVSLDEFINGQDYIISLT